MTEQDKSPVVTDAEVIERLRKRQENRWDGRSQDYHWVPDELCRLAADRLEAALSSGVRVKRWLVEETLPSGSVRWMAYEHEHQARSTAETLGNCKVTPLYELSAIEPTQAPESATAEVDEDVFAALQEQELLDGISSTSPSHAETVAPYANTREPGEFGDGVTVERDDD